MSFNVTHKFQSNKSDGTDPTIVQPSNWNDNHSITGFPFNIVSDFNFAAQTPGGSLIIGSNTITLNPVPSGVNGTNTNHYLYISNGAGTAEAVLITGGTAVSGATTGTVIVTCAHTHSGAWTIQSATAGWQEAAWVAGLGGLVIFTPGTYIVYGKFTCPYASQTYFGFNSNLVTISPANSTNLGPIASVNTLANITFDGLGFFGNFINQSYPATTLIDAINGTSSTGLTIQRCKFRGFGYTSAADAAYAQVISLYTAFDAIVSNCLFLSNLAIEININGSDSIKITNNQFGLSTIAESQSHIDWWDCRSGGFGTICIASKNIYYANNRTFGVSRSSSLSSYGYAISTGGGSGQGYNIQIYDNVFYGLGNCRGTVAVTNGSGAIVGSNTAFVSGDVHRSFVVEGDTTTYTISAYSSATGITVTPVMVRASGSGLRYQYQNSGDAISPGPTFNLSIIGNCVYDSGDMACDLGGTYTQHFIVSNNIFARSQVMGLYMGGAIFDGIISNNLFINNGKKLLTGHQGAIEISPTNQGSESAQTMWHINFTGNRFMDDQASATQLYGFEVEIASIASIITNSFIGNTYAAYAGGGALFNPAVTVTMQGTMFTLPTLGAVKQMTPIVFASLGLINGSSPAAGTLVYCSDAKSVADGATIGSVAVNGGTGTILAYLGGSWKVGF